MGRWSTEAVQEDAATNGLIRIRIRISSTTCLLLLLSSPSDLIKIHLSDHHDHPIYAVSFSCHAHGGPDFVDPFN